jgi:nucleotide-binding universal stress UspA family protein
MKTVIATDGTLTAEQVLPYIKPLASDDTVTVLTVVEIPRSLLNDVRAVFGATNQDPVETDAEYVSATTIADQPSAGWPGDDAIIDRYLDDQGQKRAGTLADALTEAGLGVAVDVREGEDAAATVLDALAELGPDIVLAGATGRGLFQGLLGSTSTKLMRHAPCPVLLIR